MKGNKDDIFKDANLDKVNVYRMKWKTLYLAVTITIFIVISILKFKYKIDSEILKFIGILDMIVLFQAHFGGLNINNNILISKDFIKIGLLKPIKWTSIHKIEFEPCNRVKIMYIVIYTKSPKIRIRKRIMVISNKKDLRDQIKFLCDHYNIEYSNDVKENWFIYEWWNVFKI